MCFFFLGQEPWMKFLPPEDAMRWKAIIDADTADTGAVRCAVFVVVVVSRCSLTASGL